MSREALSMFWFDKRVFGSPEEFRAEMVARLDRLIDILKLEASESRCQFVTFFMPGLGNVSIQNPETKQSEQEARGLPLPGGTSFPPEAGAASCSELVGFGDSGSSGVPGNGSTAPEADRKEG